MVTTNCLELTGQGTCTVPLTGNTAQELQQNVFKHAQQDHADVVKKMTPADQSKMIKRIQEIYNQKANVASRS
jgi:predicted small metal-binding protein